MISIFLLLNHYDSYKHYLKLLYSSGFHIIQNHGILTICRLEYFFCHTITIPINVISMQKSLRVLIIQNDGMLTIYASDYVFCLFAYFSVGKLTTLSCQQRIIPRLLNFRNKGACFVDMEASPVQKLCNNKKRFAYVSLWWKCNSRIREHLFTI